jgi:hypothetical protein
VEEQVVGVQTFRVLDKAPRVFNLRASDVPDISRSASDETTPVGFDFGVRVIYLTYDYEGMCPGTQIVYALYRDSRRPIQESIESWSRSPQGQHQISFPAPGEGPFDPGAYEIVVSVAGAEPARLPLTIQAPESYEPRPTFGNISIALGVQPDGKALLTAPDNRFDWNTKIVYAIFDYANMSSGVRWAAVWSRAGQEVAREEHVWISDPTTADAKGRLWVAYYNENGRPLAGGDYTVTLYIENVAQSEAAFRINFYVAP